MSELVPLLKGLVFGAADHVRLGTALPVPHSIIRHLYDERTLDRAKIFFALFTPIFMLEIRRHSMFGTTTITLSAAAAITPYDESLQACRRYLLLIYGAAAAFRVYVATTSGVSTAMIIAYILQATFFMLLFTCCPRHHWAVLRVTALVAPCIHVYSYPDKYPIATELGLMLAWNLFFVGVVLRPSARLWISEKAGLSTLIVDLEQVTARRRRSSGASSSGPGSSSSEYPLEVGSVKSHHTAKVGGGPHSSGQAEPHSSRSQRSSRSRSPGRKKRE